MANLIAAADGNWTAAATWANAEAGSGAAQLTRSASTASTTSYVYSSAFTCTNLDVLDGVLLHCKRDGVNGTVTIALSEDNGVTATREVTVNASDIPATQGWFFFKFPSTLTADGGSDYKIGVKESAAGSGATFYRDGTAGNWARLVRTTTAPAGAPAAGDNLFVAGEWTAAATTTPRAVTMDSTDSTDHGTLDIGQGGSVTFGVTAATAYVLKVSGDINIWSGGTLNVGTVGAAMPSDSTGTILLDCGSAVQYGLFVRNGGTFVMQGASKTGWTYLASDALANATSLTTADSTSWADNDQIIIASTTRTYSQSEIGALNGTALGTTLTVDGFAGAGGGLAAAHSGSAPTRAEIINLTRNVKVRGASALLQGYIVFEATSAVNIDWAEFSWLGSATANKRGLDIQTTTGSFNMAGSSWHTMAVAGSMVLISGAASSNITISNCVGGNISGANSYVLSISATTGTWTLENSVFVLSTAFGINLADVGGAVQDVRIAGISQDGFLISEASGDIGTFDGLASHSNGLAGIHFSQRAGGVISNITVWRNTGQGINQEVQSRKNLIFNTILAFGNTTTNIAIGQAASTHNLGITIKNGTFAGDSTFATSYGISAPVQTGDVFVGRLENCTFGVALGIYVAHTTADWLIGTDAFIQAVCSDCNLASPTPFSSLANSPNTQSYLAFQRYGGVAGDHRTYFWNGLIQTDSVIYKTAAPSERITPSSATVKIESGKASKVVDNGGTVTFSVWVRKSAAGDAGGADYNGNQPRLVIKANPALGIDADVVLDTMTAAVGNWEQLTGTSAAVTDDGVLQAVVDSDGTAGWINTDDWT